MRLCLAIASMLLLSSQAYASTESELMLCAAQTDKLDRLVCYDALAAAIAKDNSVSPADISATAAVPATFVEAKQNFDLHKPLAVKEEFGLVKKSEVEKIDRLYFNVAQTKKDAHSSLIVTLDNGQVWKQNGSQHFKLKNGQKVYIERGAFGSFLLGSDDRNSTIRVKRLK